MLEVFIKYICSVLLAIVGCYIIKKISRRNFRFDKKTIIVLLINGVLIVITHFFFNNSTLLNYFINVITYMIIFRLTTQEAIIITGILILYILISDIINLVIQMITFPLYKYPNNIVYYAISNLIVIIITLLIIQIKIITTQFEKAYNVLSKKDLKINVIFIIFIMTLLSSIIYNLYTNYRINYKIITDILILVSLLVITLIFVKNKDTYNKLSREYDVLLSSVENFEEWIEKEQFIRHEYKNQLAVLYAMTNDKEVKNEISGMIAQNIKIEDNTVQSLKELPKGGLKGLLYYKVIVAQKNKIKLTIDVSINKKSILTKLSKKQINELSKVIGIYFDNAIEVAKKSKKKIISLEIYELKEKVNIVISNTFRKNSIISNNEEKGLSSKGEKRGYGLYFAKEIIKNNKWILTKKEIIDNYYIETISIFKNTSK